MKPLESKHIEHAKAWLKAAFETSEDSYCTVCGHYGERSQWLKLTAHGDEYECPGCGLTHALPEYLPDSLSEGDLESFDFDFHRDRYKCWENADPSKGLRREDGLTKEEIIALGLEGMVAAEEIEIELEDPHPPTQYSGVIKPKEGHAIVFRHAATEPWTPASSLHIEDGDVLRVSVRDGVVYIEAEADGAQKGDL